MTFFRASPDRTKIASESRQRRFCLQRTIAMRMVQHRFLSLWSLPFVVVANGSLPRRLEEAEFEYNSLADFQLRFEKCQFVKTFDDEQESMLALKHFAVFRLCNDCEECEVYGTYAMEVENYLQYTIESQQEDFETMCENCDERCNEDGEYCSGCGQLCYQYENLEDLGYLDASEYTECNLWEPENGDDDAAANGDDANQAAYYIGPRCNSGNSIAIGVFSDENCWEPIDDVDVEDLLGAKLSYHVRLCGDCSGDERLSRLRFSPQTPLFTFSCCDTLILRKIKSVSHAWKTMTTTTLRMTRTM